MENQKTLQTLQNGNIDNQKSVTTEGTGTVLKELNLEEITRTISPAVKTSGWKQFSTGESSEIDFNKRFDFYIRRRNLSELMMQNDDILKKSSNEVDTVNRSKASKINGFETFPDTVSNPPMGNPKKDLTPLKTKSKEQDRSVIRPGNNLPVLSSFSNYQSLSAIRPDSPALVISFDSEWYYQDPVNKSDRILLSWQFSVIDGNDLVEYIFVRKNLKYRLNLELAIGRILDSLSYHCTDNRKVRKYESQTGKNLSTGDYTTTLYDTDREALEHSRYPYPDGKKTHIRYDWSKTPHIPVVLLCHTGKVDISGFDQSGKRNKDILKYCTEVQGGLITMQPTRLYAPSLKPKYAYGRNPHTYPIEFNIADTMCHAPAKMKSLKDLGEAVGWHKVELEKGVINHMDQLLMDDPCKYFEYAANDSTVALLYESALYGYNNKPPVTITSAAAHVMKDSMMSYLGCANTAEFDRKYRGLEKIGHGLVKRPNKPGYVESSSLEPISDKANTIQYYASQAYHGGYNGSSDIGYFFQTTFDYDLKNAYPTCMCLVPAVDWENPVKSEIVNRELTLQDFVNPDSGGYASLTMMFCYVRFEFPETVKYPCIPVNVEGVPIYPSTSEGLDGVYACGPELFLALKLGAKVFVEQGYVLNAIINPENGKMSYSLRSAVKQLVADRDKAKAEHGKKSLEELILKTMVNSGYGKTAQNVVEKSTWSAYKDEMENLGCSSITNPAAACMITSIVRAVLLATQNQCHELGYMTCSVTTDGFISDVPEDTLKSLDLFGFRHYMEQARLFLTDNKNPEIWEIKHCQDDLINFTTRGNVSLYCKSNPMLFDGKEYEGVCAHNSTKSGYDSDTYKDRLWLMTQVLSRTKAVEYKNEEWTTFKELAQGKDFIVRNTVKHIRMDFDMKRKPDRKSFSSSTVTVENSTYEIANFTTVPFRSVAEFKEYRERKVTIPCLRTISDWDAFWLKSDTKTSKTKVRDMAWAVLNSCIIGHRAGFWTIPKLNELSGAERDAWINSHNNSSKVWKANDWKNAGRNTRQVNMLQRELIKDKLQELMNDK